MKQKRVAICAEDKGNIRRCCVFQSLKALLKKREKFQATAEETRMMKHLQRRNELHEELHAEQLEAERCEREHTENLAALHALGEKHSRAELDNNTELRNESLRLSNLVNHRRTPFTSSTSAEQLIASCLEMDLQEQSRASSETLTQAKQKLHDARPRET